MAVERFPSECIWFERAPQSSAVETLVIRRRRSLAPKDLCTTRHLHRSFGGQRRPPQDDNSS